jgi:hypothetical protein
MKLARLLSFVMVVVMISGLYVGDVLAETVGYWRFEEGTEGALVATVKDYSSHKHDGEGFNLALGDFAWLDEAEEVLIYSTEVPVSTIPQTGEANKYALRLDGIDDYVKVTTSDALNLFETGEITVEAWVYVEGAREGIAWAVTNWDYSVTNDAWGLGVIKQLDGTFEVFAAIGDGKNPTDGFVSSGAKIKKREWYHIAFIYADGEYTVYVNGVQAGKGPDGNVDIHTMNPEVSGTVMIGRQTSGPLRHLEGMVDEVRVSSKALDPSELLCSSK